MPWWRGSITEITSDTYSTKDSLSDLSGEICVGFVVIVHIKFVSSDELAVASNTSNTSISIAVTTCTAAIINKDNLLANNALGIGFITIRTLADTSIVQEDERTLAL